MVKGGLLFQILDEATFYWFQRSHAVDSPFYTLSNLIQLDRRLAGLLRLLPTLEGFDELFAEGFTEEQEFEYYCLLAAAAPLPKVDLFSKVEETLNKGGCSQEITAIISWLSYKTVHNTVSKLWESENPEMRHIAIASWRNHRVKTAIDLVAAINDKDISIACASIRFIGEMGLTNHITDIEDLLTNENEQIRFWATYSIILLGGNKGLQNMYNAIENKTENCSLAIISTYPILSAQEAISWVNQLSQNKGLLKETIKSFEIIGLTKYIPWLISLIKDRAIAPHAAHAFCVITGISLQSGDFGDLLALFGDPHGDSSEDFHLAAKSLKNVDFNSIWSEYQNHFDEDERLFFGKSLTKDNLKLILNSGNQQQRKRAALEMAIMSPEEPLFEHGAPGFRQ